MFRRRRASRQSAAPAADSSIAAGCIDLRKTYGAGDAAVHALDGVTVNLHVGQFTAIMGPSGSGKSTLMHCLAGLDRPTSGACGLGDISLAALGEKQLTQLRRDHIGFIFQQFNLLPTLTAEENILLPLNLAGRDVNREWYEKVVEAFGLVDRLTHKPKELSGGQQQRVACARALVSQPSIIFADEPTGNLDSNSSAEVLSLLRTCVDELGQTMVMVTHDPGAAAHTDRVIFLADGNIAGELYQPTAAAIHAHMQACESGQTPPATAPPAAAHPTSPYRQPAHHEPVPQRASAARGVTPSGCPAIGTVASTQHTPLMPEAEEAPAAQHAEESQAQREPEAVPAASSPPTRTMPANLWATPTNAAPRHDNRYRPGAEEQRSC